MMTVDLQRLALAPGHRVLDLGCGEGRHSLSAYLQPDVEVFGVDLSAEDLGTAMGRIADMRDYEPQGRLQFLQGDALRLPFADHSFDRVICSEVLEHIPNYLSVLEEIQRVLKPGGKLCISVPRAWPEYLCWRLSWDYHNTPGGHIRIFDGTHLRREIERFGLDCYHQHGAHALHVPYWWLKCLFWRREAEHWLVAQYHRLLVWDLLESPRLTRTLERFLNPWLGKSIVQYFDKPMQPRQESVL
jgi:SAM-dependent methyltransferase